jgi:hypothetical protein
VMSCSGQWIQAWRDPRHASVSRSCSWAKVHDNLDDLCCENSIWILVRVNCMVMSSIWMEASYSGSELISIGHSDTLLVLEMLRFLKSKLL